MRISKLRLRENINGYLFCAPGIILFLTVGLYSVCFSIFLSFWNWTGVDFFGTARFVGIENFKTFLAGANPIRTARFWASLLRNFQIGFFSILFIVPIALALAFVVTNTRGAGVYRTVFFIPMVASGAGVFYAWQGLFSARGFFNFLMRFLGLEMFAVRQGMFGDPNTALTGIIITVIWGAIPGTMMLYYAGLANIDQTLYEAADIDGANKFQQLWRITWPLLKPMTIIVIIQQLNGAFQMFENVWVMTQGGPGGNSDVVGTIMYTAAFQDNAYGLTSAMGWSVFVLTLVLSLVSMRGFVGSRGNG
jgi:ABC-type sugar transport system permease subunit